jgi:heavy metal efflux system protein
MKSMVRVNCILLLLLLDLSIFSQDSTYYKTLSLYQFIDSALSNHPEIKNSNLQLLKAKSKDIFNIKPAEIQYEQGQLYSSEVDKGYEIHQSFGSPLLWAAEKGIKNSEVKLRETEAELIKTQLAAKVKSAYYTCIYQLNRLSLLNKQKIIFDTLLNSVTDTNEVNEARIQLSEKLIETRYAELLNQFNEISSDYYFSKNILLRECYMTSDMEPANEELRIIEISASYDTSNRVPGKLKASFYQKNIDLANSRLKAENARFFPEISAGYFNRSINRIRGYSGWQIGFTVPLWVFTPKSSRNEALINKQIALNEFEWHQFNDKKNAEGLLIEMDRLFEKLNYFYESGLNNAFILEQTAIKLIKEKHQANTEILLALNTSYKIRCEYLETINAYNQKAIELELYTY